MYSNGRGVEQDDEEAVRWYRQAAEAGHPRGMYRLGRGYELGQGVPENRADAIQWYQRAADLGDELAIAALERFGVR